MRMNATVRSFIVAALMLTAGCSAHAPASHSRSSTTLRIGLGASASTSAGADAGLAQIVANLTTEPLVLFARDGRPAAVLASHWSTSPDGRTLRLALREAAFHDGAPVTAALVKQVIEQRLPRQLGPAFDDIRSVEVASERELLFHLNRPSTFLLEAFDGLIAKPGAPGVGSGAFLRSAGDGARLLANEAYTGGVPALSGIELKSYGSVRAAWADLLRGNLDMLYEVGVEALDSLEPSSQVRVYSYRRHYQFVVIFNLRKPEFRDPVARQRLSAAVDRQRLISEALRGRGTPSAGPVWPDHWAAPKDHPPLPYAPQRMAPSHRPLTLSLLIVDPAHEKLAIALQRQLRSVGVAATLEMPGPAVGLKRIEDGDFDLVLSEVASAPTLLRPYLFWHSKGPYNLGEYASLEVDAALDSIRHAVDDEAYKTGVAAFQRAILNDPPAIFLAWSERARAVSTAFDVPAEPGRDPLGTLRLWRPAAAAAVPADN